MSRAKRGNPSPQISLMVADKGKSSILAIPAILAIE
jgi:hypothetical protein